jgi:segregation and condensation protein A
MSFVVKQQAFEGPLDLLLSLIEKRKLFINDISLAKVADDYINHIKQFERFPIADSANFILVASTLLLIKSKSLLPTLELTEEEQGSIEDLENRLRIYQRMKDLSVHLKERFGAHIIFAKNQSRKIVPVFSPDESMTVPNLLAAIRNVLRSLPKTEKLAQVVVKKVISLEEMIENLTGRIKSSLRMSFKDFSNMGKEEKVNVIVGFLAMLELVKQGIIAVTQEKRFDDIHMETKEVGVPRY